MRGLELEETAELFAQRAGVTAAESSLSEIKAAHEITDGHAFWIDLMAVQVARVPGVTLKNLVEDVRRGRGDTPDVLSPIWETLADREKTVLRVMAETVRPETEDLIQKFVSSELNYQKFKKALKTLILLNLIVVKPETNSPDLFDLHPLVRQFVRKNFEKPERAGFIQTVLNQYVIIIRGYGEMLGVFLPFPLLERWSQKAELEIEAGLYEDAFKTLVEAENALLGGGHTEEFVRVARKLFEKVDWQINDVKPERFDHVIATMIDCLNKLEEYSDANDMLRRYEETVPLKTARYIRYCDVRCYSYWLRGEFEDAKEWGSRGDELKASSNVDTDFDCAHNLALAKRDGGDPEGALEYFLGQHDLAVLTDPSSETESVRGPTLGNVGRCLELLGKDREALICYRKSAKMLEDDTSGSRIDNQAYARHWIAQVLARLGERELAHAFFLQAENLVRNFAPARARMMRNEMESLYGGNAPPKGKSMQSKRLVDDWIHGRTSLISI